MTASVPVRLPAHLRAAILAHVRTGAPREACGLLAGTAAAGAGGRATAWHPARNRLESELRFEVHPDDARRVLLEIDARGEVVWAIVHSHVRSAAVPSPTDRAGAAWWPGTLQLIVSLVDPAEPSLRAWRIVGDAAVEIPVEIG